MVDPNLFQDRNFYADHGLDRCSIQRGDSDWLDKQLTSDTTCLLPVWRGQILVQFSDASSETPTLLAWNAAVAQEWVQRAQTIIWLGTQEERSYYALDFSHQPNPATDPWKNMPNDPIIEGHFVDLRNVGPIMARKESALLAYARAMILWHQKQFYCGKCGHPTQSIEAGHARLCSNLNCAISHFPRTDPAVIVLILDQQQGEKQHCLLARNSGWRHKPGMRSTLAGFVEPGESLEDSVRREMFEEVGIRIGSMIYHSSQPWPFPGSIMLGFYARAETTKIILDPAEIAEAGWYSRDQIRNSPENEHFCLPSSDSIARRLIDEWVQGLVTF